MTVMEGAIWGMKGVILIKQWRMASMRPLVAGLKLTKVNTEEEMRKTKGG